MELFGGGIRRWFNSGRHVWAGIDVGSSTALDSLWVLRRCDSSLRREWVSRQASAFDGAFAGARVGCSSVSRCRDQEVRVESADHRVRDDNDLPLEASR